MRSSGESGAGDTTADTVFGQNGSFTSRTCSAIELTANSLCFPSGIAVDGSGNVYVADGNSERVLEYNTPLTSDTNADNVFGTCGSYRFVRMHGAERQQPRRSDGSRGGLFGQSLRGG